MLEKLALLGFLLVPLFQIRVKSLHPPCLLNVLISAKMNDAGASGQLQQVALERNKRPMCATGRNHVQQCRFLIPTVGPR